MRAEDTPSRSLLRSTSIAPGAHWGGQNWDRRTQGEAVYTGLWNHSMAIVSLGLCGQLTTRGRKLLPTHTGSRWPLL